MRTTLNVDDDVYQAIRSIARADGRTLGEVVSDLARRGLARCHESADTKGFPTFAVTDDVAPLTAEMVSRADTGD